MTIGAFFNSLGAPLRNLRTSWEARRPKDGAVFLRSWRHEMRTDADGKQWVQIPYPFRDEGESAGWHERQKHVSAIKTGASCFIILCDAVDVSMNQLTIDRFERRTLAVGGRVKHEDGHTWIRVEQYKSIWEL